MAERMTGVQGAILEIQSNIEVNLANRLQQILNVVSAIGGPKVVSSDDAVNKLNKSVESLRSRLLEAMDGMLGEVEDEHALLADKISEVFFSQSETAGESVAADFVKVVKTVIENEEAQVRVVEQLLETFMHGLISLGQYQHINITQQTQESIQKIKAGIESAIKEVFKGIEDMEEKIGDIEKMIPSLPKP